jgi:hypothetical protein
MKKTLNKISKIFLLCMMVVVLNVPVLAQESSNLAEERVEEKVDITEISRIMPKEYISKIEDNDPLKYFVPKDINFMCEVSTTRSSTIWVAITEPCDQYWRNDYPTNWMWQANRVISNADTPLSGFGISFYSVAQKEWDSSSTTHDDLIQEAIDEWGLTNGADLMVAFTGRSGTIFGRVSAIGDPYILVYDYGYDENKMTTLHESGHAYGLTHCAQGTDCVMSAAAPLSTFNSMCSTHETEWENHKNDY